MHSLIYADPAWQYRDKRLKHGGAEAHYRTAKMAEIAMHIEVDGKPNPDGCTMACWQTWPMEREQDALLEGLGWKKITILFLWIKTTVNGKEHFGGGLAGTRANTEPCFLWRRGKALKRASASVRQLIFAPVTEHSAKPPEARTRLEKLYGEVPRIELYARDRTPGWEVWGDQLPTMPQTPTYATPGEARP